MNKIEGVIFDWAGTTVDFGCFAPVNVFLKIFKEKGIEVTLDEVREPMGMLKREHIKTMLKMKRINNLWREKYGKNFEEKDVDGLYSSFESLLISSLSIFSKPLPDVCKIIKLLRSNGIKIGSTTGYTDKMLQVVLENSRKNGYEPDFWITPDSTNSYGRPYPYMIYRNIEALKLSATWKVIKVGDTKSDIKEGVNAGVWSVGVIVGSSQMGLSYEEYESLSENERDEAIKKTNLAFLEAGADFTIKTMMELPELIVKINDLIIEGRN
ncbi:MAG: phosphonoacetaldehyde hydrolase [Clostridium sp.]|uniref:phosphonoacetaldehyde hydrolase n=1 Tax=Clostridium sp. TaxID=1506 RepID=UPI003D6D1F25